MLLKTAYPCKHVHSLIANALPRLLREHINAHELYAQLLTQPCCGHPFLEYATSDYHLECYDRPRNTGSAIAVMDQSRWYK